MISIEKKRIVAIIALVLVVVVLATFVFTGCDLARKIKGAERTFPGKISKTKQLSFKMNISYTKDEVTTVIDMDCYRVTKDDGVEEYAYVYSCPGSSYKSYKNIYADGKLYEIINVTDNAGTYYIKDGVSVDDDGNILYHITKKIFLTSVVAFVSKAKKETLRDEEVYRYDVSISGKSVSLWYNSEVLVQLYVAFESEGGGTEEYTIALSDYTFDQDLPENTFKRPDTYGITYLPSPMSFEDWMGILTTFSQKLG